LLGTGVFEQLSGSHEQRLLYLLAWRFRGCGNKERILLRPLSFYQKLFDYMKPREANEQLHTMWQDSGYVLEPLWAFIFGELPVSHGVPKCVMTHCPWK
jgi:hypothetical protein